MKEFKPTKKQKEMIRKVAPNLANALFDEDNRENKEFIYEMAIMSAVRKASFNGDNYLGLNKIARAISEGIGEDLPTLIKELNKLKN